MLLRRVPAALRPARRSGLLRGLPGKSPALPPGSSVPSRRQARTFFWESMLNMASGSNTRTATANALVGGSGLPAPSEAQQKSIVRIPGFLSDTEIGQVLETAAEIQRDGAGAVRLQDSASDTDIDLPPPSWDPGGYEVSRGDWCTTYLHTMKMFQQRLPELHAKIKATAQAVDEKHWGVVHQALQSYSTTIGEGHDGQPVALNTRCIEMHTAGPSGGLPHTMHYDQGSCITIDIMLREPDSGGEFQTLEIPKQNSQQDRASQNLVTHSFHKGDAIVFPSHKYHSVRPVTAGLRQVLILELWIGEERSCNHRCEQHFGRCSEPMRGMWNASTGSYVAW